MPSAPQARATRWRRGAASSPRGRCSPWASRSRPWDLNDAKSLNGRGGWRQLTAKDAIQPGDLATRSSGSHQALVTVVRPDEIETAEGNTDLGGGSGLENSIGGKIAHKRYSGKGVNFPAWNTGFWRPPGVRP